MRFQVQYNCIHKLQVCSEPLREINTDSEISICVSNSGCVIIWIHVIQRQCCEGVLIHSRETGPNLRLQQLQIH